MSVAHELYARGAYYEAHEVWEEAWLVAPRGTPERARLEGLIQLCAAAVQTRRARWGGVATLAARSVANLEAAGDAALAAAVRAWAARVEEERVWSEPPGIEQG